MTPSSLTRTRDALERGIAEGLHLGAQLYVSLAGEATDLVVGERRPAAVALARLWEAGELDLDDPVARFVPEFGAHGKAKGHQIKCKSPEEN